MTIVGLGEVLFDVFEDGTATLGGAPLNVAVHAHQLIAPLGLGEGIVASRIGSDPHGQEILQLLETRCMPTRYIQTDKAHPTGTVSVFMHEGEPGYQIEAGAAWDFIEETDALEELAIRCDAVCFGSLAQRSPKSRATVMRFLQNARKALRLYDVNLRRNRLTNEAGYSREIIAESCKLSTMIKLNIAELHEICRMFGLGASSDGSDEGVRGQLEKVLAHFPVESIILTRGAEGTTLFTRQGEFTGHTAAVQLPESKVHPVGAGDACTAGMLCATVLGWEPGYAVDLANRMGSWVASQLSATPALPESITIYMREGDHSRTAV